MKYKISQDNIDVWLYPLQSLPQSARHDLAYDEQQRAMRYHLELHRTRFIAARRTLRWILAKYLQIPLQSIDFISSDHGKPSLRSGSICFNLSHSKDWALLAISQHAVGIDLEFFSSRPFLNIAKHIFSTKEQLLLAKLPPMLIPMAFFSLWSQKEAVIKANGQGLSYPTHLLEMQPFNHDPVNLIDPIDKTQWQIRRFMPMVNCCAAICHHTDITNIRYHKLPSLLETL